MAPEVILDAESSLLCAITETGSDFQNTTIMTKLPSTTLNKSQQEASRLIINATYCFFGIFHSDD